LSGLPATSEEGGLPVDYWRLPLAPQGTPPARWSDVERSLSPEHCSQCHAERHAEWRSSIHAAAFSPGLVGQLLGLDDAEAAQCLQCHAPLDEQRTDFVAARHRGAGHLPAAYGLAASGNGCAGCHLRGHRRFGPPRRAGAAPAPDGAVLPHDGAMRSADFEGAEFCAACHQFPAEQAINGKPLQNTLEEWKGSPQAARGITCQGCHMPDRRHLWRGIHDPEMVAAGLTHHAVATDDGARFELTNTGVGHAFPTYVTPKVLIRAVALDAAGRPRPDSAAEIVIQRRVVFENGEWIEKRDTRLHPGETAVLKVPWADAAAVRMWIEVHPDDFYDHDVYDGLLAGLAKDGPEYRLIAEADRRARTSRFTLFETVISRP
jgi:hypothetical protein